MSAPTTLLAQISEKPTCILLFFLEPVGRCPTPQLCNQQCNHDICARSGKLCCCQGCAKDCTTPVWSLDVRMYKQMFYFMFLFYATEGIWNG